MAKQNQTGHAINVANLEDEISICTGYEGAYNPAKKTLTLPELLTRHVQ